MNQKELNDKFIEACKAGNLELIKKYHKMGANIHTWNDWTLRLTAENGHLHVVKYLVENGVNIHTWNGWTLRLTAENGHLHVVNYLREVDRGKCWKCYECIVRTTCTELCEDYLK